MKKDTNPDGVMVMSAQEQAEINSMTDDKNLIPNQATETGDIASERFRKEITNTTQQPMFKLVLC